jgi:hypothetical protein
MKCIGNILRRPDQIISSGSKNDKTIKMKLKKLKLSIFILPVLSLTIHAQVKEVFEMPENIQTRWSSFENPTAEKGVGGQVAKGSKGYPYHLMQPGESVELLNVEGSGIIHRIWMTVDDLFNKPEEFRSMKIEMYWDGSEKAAVSAPLEDFFNQVFGIMTAFDNALFSSPEGRSFMSYVQMPFRSSARIVVTNESKVQPHRLFYDVNLTMVETLPENTMYFHAYWQRDKATTPGVDFEIVPHMKARGRFLGCNIGIVNSHRYSGWWGEGEVKVYLDGDDMFPTLVGTGTEDYIGSGWSQGVFHTNFMGSSIIDDENGKYAFYRFHMKDPVYFYDDVKITIQQMGGTQKGTLRKMMEEGKPAIPVCYIIETKEQLNFFDGEASFSDDTYGDGVWTNYYRQDDVCATSYFYLTTPNGILNEVEPFEHRR